MYKLVNLNKYQVLPRDQMIFILSDKQRKQADEIYKEKGTISYIFGPTGIGWTVKLKVWETGEIIDITDYDTW